MVSATSCRINDLVNLEDYCTKEIEPLLLKSGGNPVYFGKYNAEGDILYCVNSLYATKPPSLHSLGTPPVSPKKIKKYLEALGFVVEVVQVKEYYEAGYSGTGRTKYYNSGYNIYYSLKISY
jgi:hypothetical protein